ncbi:uncharacterized protein LOC143269021 [Peromyscus maniculatus bairdii]|uniref:uncharacterized protein LOC143269021 n=1 Tax=Peromyscus maniculatus bairdii TaxID=230844 RepID=UPI003FD3FD6F
MLYKQTQRLRWKGWRMKTLTEKSICSAGTRGSSFSSGNLEPAGRPVPPRSSPERRQARYSGVKVAQSGRAVGEFLHGTGGIAARQARRRQRAEATQSGPVPKRRVPQECGSCSSGQKTDSAHRRTCGLFKEPVCLPSTGSGAPNSRCELSLLSSSLAQGSHLRKPPM